MSATAFDTLKYANTLKSAGVPPQQAEAQANAMADALSVNLSNLATKDDLKLGNQKLSAEMKEADQRLSAEMKEGDQKLSARIDQLEQKLSARIDQLDQKLTAKIDVAVTKLSGEQVWMRWMVGVQITLMVMLLFRTFMGR